jgi:hypothetical protein
MTVTSLPLLPSNDSLFCLLGVRVGVLSSVRSSAHKLWFSVLSSVHPDVLCRYPKLTIFSLRLRERRRRRSAALSSQSAYTEVPNPPLVGEETPLPCSDTDTQEVDRISLLYENRLKTNLFLCYRICNNIWAVMGNKYNYAQELVSKRNWLFEMCKKIHFRIKSDAVIRDEVEVEELVKNRICEIDWWGMGIFVESNFRRLPGEALEWSTVGRRRWDKPQRIWNEGVASYWGSKACGRTMQEIARDGNLAQGALRGINTWEE